MSHYFGAFRTYTVISSVRPMSQTTLLTLLDTLGNTDPSAQLHIPADLCQHRAPHTHKTFLLLEH